MTTRSKARIYRRDPRPLPDEACPQCFRLITIHPETFRRRLHRDQEGRDCTGSGVTVGEPSMPGIDVLNIDVVIAERCAKPDDRRLLAATGECHDCGRSVSGERRVCGQCLQERMGKR